MSINAQAQAPKKRSWLHRSTEFAVILLILLLAAALSIGGLAVMGIALGFLTVPLAWVAAFVAVLFGPAIYSLACGTSGAGADAANFVQFLEIGRCPSDIVTTPAAPHWQHDLIGQLFHNIGVIFYVDYKAAIEKLAPHFMVYVSGDGIDRLIYWGIAYVLAGLATGFLIFVGISIGKDLIGSNR